MKKKRRKRNRRRLFIAVILFCIILTVIKLPSYITDKKLIKLGYTKETAALIRKQKLATRILNYQYYSPYLEKSFQNGSVNKDYLPLYLNMYQDRTLSENDFLLCQRLQDIGYDTEQIQNLYANLSYEEILPLILYSYQYYETPYIDDVVANRSSDNIFRVSGSYYTPYDNVKTYTSLTNDILINQTHMLTQDVVPSDLVQIDTTYAVEGIQMAKEAANAYMQMASQAGSEGVWFYAISGYVSYDAQSQYYENMAFYNGESYAYLYIPQAGASEQQTGLSVAVTAANHESEDFTTTSSYKWLQENAANYGFIFRYQANKEPYTNYPQETNYLRYLGKDLAKQVNESGMAYDLFYQLYLSDWNEDKYIPTLDILSAIPYYNVTQDTTPTSSPTVTSTPTSSPSTERIILSPKPIG